MDPPRGAIGVGHHFDASRPAVWRDVAVVTFNYRKGVFGGFGLPGLEGSGSFGLLDQRAPLERVRRNAEAFRGDPGNVTLFGVESFRTGDFAKIPVMVGATRDPRRAPELRRAVPRRGDRRGAAALLTDRIWARPTFRQPAGRAHADDRVRLRRPRGVG